MGTKSKSKRKKTAILILNLPHKLTERRRSQRAFPLKGEISITQAGTLKQQGAGQGGGGTHLPKRTHLKENGGTGRRGGVLFYGAGGVFGNPHTATGN